MDPITVIKAVIYAVFSFILPIKGLLILAIFMTFFDAFVAWWATRKQGLKVCSEHTFNYIFKCAVYIFAIFAGYLIDLYIIGGAVLLPFVGIKVSYFASKLGCGLISLNIGQRINENWVKAGNESLWTSLKDFLTGLKSVKKDIKDLTDNDKKSE